MLAALTALASVKGDVDDGKWVFLDFNNNQDRPGLNEVRVAERLAGRGRLRVFRTPAQFKAYLAAHPSEKITTLVMSGHAYGDAYMPNRDRGDSDGMSPAAMRTLIDKYPGLKSVTGLFGLGCYTGEPENAQAWVNSFPAARFAVGFDGEGPSGYLSELFLSQMQKGRRNLPASPTLAQLAAAFRQNAGFRANRTASVAIVDHGQQKMNFVSRVSGASVVSLKPPDNRACYAKLKSLQELVKPAEDLATFFDRYRALAADEARTRWTLANEVPVGDGNILRQAYYRLHAIVPCHKTFFADAAVQKFLNCDGKGARYVRHDLITLIHADAVAKNFLVCAGPLLKTVGQRFERCAASAGNAVTVEMWPSHRRALIAQKFKSLQGPLPNPRRSLLELMNALSSNESSSEMHYLVSVLGAVVNAGVGNVPPEAWQRPITSPADRACQGLKSMTSNNLEIAQCPCGEFCGYMPSGLDWAGSSVDEGPGYDIDGRVDAPGH